MRLSNLADYAVVLMSAAARQCGSVPLHAALLAEQTGIPAPTAQKLVSLLARAGLLVSSRGSGRSEENTSELQSLMRISYAVFCLKKKKATHKVAQTTRRQNNERD